MESYASNEPRIGIVKTAMGACAQFAVFTYAEMRRTPRYEIRLAAFYADNLMNSVAHCGGFYLWDIVEEKCRLRPACQELPGLSREKTSQVQICVYIHLPAMLVRLCSLYLQEI